MNTKDMEGPAILLAVAVAVILIAGLGFYLINRKDRPASAPGSGRVVGGAVRVVGGGSGSRSRPARPAVAQPLGAQRRRGGAD